MIGVEKKENIIIKGATANNLKNIDISIPVNAFTCVTGVSGCGKSSLVYDTIYAESQRAFLESMSGNIYGQKLMDKPKVKSIENLYPALNVSQNYYNYNPRSTVGTLTDISHYLRTLYALVINYDFDKNYNDSYFSFNNPNSSCKHCKGLGEEYVVSEDLLIPDKTKTLKNGAIILYKGKNTSIEYKTLIATCEYFGIDPDKKYEELTENEKYNLLYRENSLEFELSFKTPKGKYRKKVISQKGAVTELNIKLNDIDTPSTFANISKYLTKEICSACGGTKLNSNILSKTICGKNIAEVEHLQLSEILFWIKAVTENYKHSSIFNEVDQLTTQIINRISNMIDLNVGYISLDRSVPTLSGGEIQRIRIATQLNCSLKGLIYILDEPCKGLHERNIQSIISATKNIILKGNTVIAIEHNKRYISQADKIIELGPVGGPDGGYLLNENKSASDYSCTVQFKDERTFKKYIKLKNIFFRNISNQHVQFPVGAITCITGVSGSGKSTLISVIEKCFTQRKNVYCEEVEGLTYITKINNVNQKPIGKTPRSTVISYLEIYDKIRALFSGTPEAINSGLCASDFSMNISGGRCECCQGTGLKKIELNYLPDTFITCPECNGKRFKSEVLNIKYKNMNINDVLDTPISLLMNTFSEEICIYEKLKCMVDIGLGYIKLGQMSMNLSGGEAQRIKLAKALGVKSTGKNMYILDEPTSGLNSTDIDKFCNILFELQSHGETILVVDHNIEFISKIADYMIDFGITAGHFGGKIVAQGNPQEVYYNSNSSWNQPV